MSEPDLPGEIFSPSLWPGPTVICRAFHFEISSEDGVQVGHKVCFRHGQVTGCWVLIVDGAVAEIGFEPIVHRSFTINFQLPVGGRSHDASITAEGTSSIGYVHILTVNGKEITEFREPDGIDLGEKIPMHVSIPDTRTFYDGSRQVTMYQLFTKSGVSGHAIVERRYSEFSTLDKLIRAQVEPHILPSLPKLPGKYSWREGLPCTTSLFFSVKILNPWVDQNEESFIIHRKEALELYLCELLKNYYVSQHSFDVRFVPVDQISSTFVASGFKIHRFLVLSWNPSREMLAVTKTTIVIVD